MSAGAYALGSAGFAGSAAAQSDGFNLYALTPSTQVYEGQAEAEDSYTKPDGTTVTIDTASKYRAAFSNWGIENQTLIEIDGTPPDAGEVVSATPIVPQNLADEAGVNNVVQAATIAYNPADDMLYGIANQNYGPADPLKPDDGRAAGRYVFKLDPSSGNLTLLGGPNDELRYLWGSTFDTDGTTLYALQSDASPNTTDEKLYTVDTATGAVSEIGTVTDTLVGDEVVHAGLSWNQLSSTFPVVGILGNFTGGAKDDLLEIDPSDASSQVADTDIFSSGALVSSAFNACVGGDPSVSRVYTVRNGDGFFTADLSSTADASDLGALDDLDVSPDPLINIDNLAEDPSVCITACTRTIGYWKNHPGCDSGPGKGKGRSDKDTIESVLENCGFIVGEGTAYEGSCDDATPDGTYDFTGDVPCEGDGTGLAGVELIVEAIDGANAKDMDSQLLAQLLAAKLNVCNGATTSLGPRDITDVIDWVDMYFSAKCDGTASDVIDDYEDANGLDTTDRKVKEMWKDTLDDYNNQNLVSCE